MPVGGCKIAKIATFVVADGVLSRCQVEVKAIHCTHLYADAADGHLRKDFDLSWSHELIREIYLSHAKVGLPGTGGFEMGLA
jgi:hypothetical protein